MAVGPVRTYLIAPVALALLIGVPAVSRAGSNPASKAPPKHSVISPWDVEAREYLGTPESEAAVEHGLSYLASTQQADGHWSSGGYRGDVGITGLCLLSFLASGHQPGRGKYGLVMNEAVNFLANCVQMSGQIGTPGLVYNSGGQSGPPMYGHGFATLALAEVYGMSHRRDLKPKIEAAIKLIEDCQNQDGQLQHDGGWRYRPVQGEADISVTVVQVLALRAARNAGLNVPQSTIDRAIAYMRRCSNPNDGGFLYQVRQGGSGPARTGAGVLSMLMAGLRDSPECQGGLHYLKTHPMNNQYEWPYKEHLYYALYYVTQAMYQAGGDYWRSWYTMIRDRLIRTQASDGDWGSSPDTSEAGLPYATAMSVLVLQVPAGLLPIYQK